MGAHRAPLSPSRGRRRLVGAVILIVFISGWVGWMIRHVTRVQDTLAIAADRRYHPAHRDDVLGASKKGGGLVDGTATAAAIVTHTEDAAKMPSVLPDSPSISQAGVGPLVTALSQPHLYATLHTDYGDIHWELHGDDAPKTVANILRMASKGVFNDSCFYRYERGFVLQGGLHCNVRKTHTKGAKTVPLEYKRPNGKLTVALARAGSDLNSGGAEFFINLADNSRGLGPSKKGGYAVFATVIGDNSLATIQRLKKLPTKKSGLTRFVDPQPVIHYISIETNPPV